MTTATALLEDVRSRGIELRVMDDRIRYRPKEAVTPELVARLRRHKSEVLNLLNFGQCPAMTLGAAEMLPEDYIPCVELAPALSREVGQTYASYWQHTAGMTYEELTQWIIDHTDPPINDGSDPLIPLGWSRPAWVRELRRMADCCEALRPDLAADYLEQADAIPLTYRLQGTLFEPNRYPRPGGGTETFVERSERCLRECGGLPPGASRVAGHGA